ncbi:MAG TPA: hypothetical protein VLL08_32220 [Kineosporiaceae bacterium]|nr:hypothetical protein [Kineosporiaceae bacterium]
MARLTLTVIGLALIRSLWSGLGPLWRWPMLLVRTLGARVGRANRKRRSSSSDQPDPFTVLEVQHRLGLIATELRVLEAKDADLTYYARAHRIHTRRSAYDQLLAEACELAGVPAQHPGPEGRICRTADERFCVEMELAARGWHW